MYPTAIPKLVDLTLGCSGYTGIQLGQGGYGPGRLTGVKPIHVHTSRRKFPQNGKEEMLVMYAERVKSVSGLGTREETGVDFLFFLYV